MCTRWMSIVEWLSLHVKFFRVFDSALINVGFRVVCLQECFVIGSLSMKDYPFFKSYLVRDVEAFLCIKKEADNIIMTQTLRAHFECVFFQQSFPAQDLQGFSIPNGLSD